MSDNISKLRQLSDQLLEVEEKLHLAVRAAKVGIWDWSVETDVLEWSDEMFLLFGKNKDEFTETYKSFIDCVHPEDRVKVDEHVSRSVQEGVKYAIAYRVIWDDGSVHEIAAGGQPFKNSSGKTTRLIGTCMECHGHECE